jgi:uncharacterized cupredoxin-like copper-binding protein
MHKPKLTRRLVAATASVALAAGIFAAAPLSADAAKKTNYTITKASNALMLQISDGDITSLNVNGI